METEVTAEALEIWTVTVPKSGPPTREAIQGTPVYTFSVPASQGDDLEASLRRLSPSLRRGRPLIYRGSRQLDAEKADADEERELAARATSQDPVEAAAAHEALQLRELRRQLSADCELKRKELAALMAQVAAAGQQLAADLARNQEIVAASMKHSRDLVADAQAHYEARLRSTWQVEADLEQHATDGLQRLGAQVEIATTAKRQIDRVMRGASASELLATAKATVLEALDSPIGQAVGAGLAARVSAAVTNRIRKDKPGAAPVDTDDVLVGYVLQGRACRARRQGLQEIRNAASDNRLAEALIVGADFILGTIEIRAVGEFLAARR